MTQPLVSVIVPSFNHSRFLDEALMSLVRQSYRPIEVIVIDDGSSDGSGALARAVLAREMPEAVVIERANRGAHHTINQGLAMARGAYLTILNSDDAYAPERLARCVAVMQQAGAEFLFTEVRCIDDAGAVVEGDAYVERLERMTARVETFPTVGYALLKSQLGVSTGNFIFSRRVWGLLGGFRHYRYVHDWDFILRALFHTEPYFLRERLYDYRLHGGNTFRGLAAVEGYETKEVMRNCLWALSTRVPENVRAPCPAYWPGFFDWFMEAAGYGGYLPDSRPYRMV